MKHQLKKGLEEITQSSQFFFKPKEVHILYSWFIFDKFYLFGKVRTFLIQVTVHIKSQSSKR